ncbi:MAG: YggS family pyridoxal phosphate-dependent enzyme [Pirellulales bacterium]|nr:YggS family pyridoxal phosphate-dependent enzyme [Pirellulales bacterium]
MDRIAENLASIRGRIAEAARRSGRPAEQIALVGVTKYASAELIRPLIAAGCLDLGESRPQQLWQRAAALADLPVRWHMIGHLQRNKVRRTLPLTTLIHSVDSRRLLAEINKEAGEAAPVPVLLEVNVSGEAAKHGFAPAEIEPLLAELPDFANVSVRGLMCMAGLESGPEEARREFAALGGLRNRLRNACPPNATLDELSMGMSGDFEQAIEEGATIVRIGSALFEGIDD